MKKRMMSCLASGVFFLMSALIVSAQTNLNTWVDHTGKWEDARSWSLGILPDSSQAIGISPLQAVSVTIDTDTVQNYRQSLTIGALGVTGDGCNLLLDGCGTSTPLTIRNGLAVSSTNLLSSLAIQDSAVIVQQGECVVTNAQLILSGGFLRATNGIMDVAGEIDVIDGLFEAGEVGLGYDYNHIYTHADGAFVQYGGTARMTNLEVGTVSPNSVCKIYGGDLTVTGNIALGAINTGSFYQYGGVVNASNISMRDDGGFGDRYYLYDGELTVAGQLDLNGTYAYNIFFQGGGTNQINYLTIGSISARSEYVLEGGLLSTSNSVLRTEREGLFDQTGGSHLISDTLAIYGNWDYHYSSIGTYTLRTGTVRAPTLQLFGGRMVVNDGASAAFADVEAGGYFTRSSAYGSLIVNGGSFSCGSFHRRGSDGAAIQQSGGALIVTNLLAFGGIGGGYYINPLVYQFSGGSLYASNIELTADMMIGSTNVQIANPGYFSLAGSLIVGNANEQLGRFVLASNANINFAVPDGLDGLTNGPGKISFASSSNEQWNNSSLLIVTNWSGAANGGGDDQLIFGSDASGLTAVQLSQIRFVNPAGFPNGTYGARLLITGEVVPFAFSISTTPSGSSFVISWSDSTYALQSATNVMGPWTNVISAISPFTNAISGVSQVFFRLQR